MNKFRMPSYYFWTSLAERWRDCYKPHVSLSKEEVKDD